MIGKLVSQEISYEWVWVMVQSGAYSVETHFYNRKISSYFPKLFPLLSVVRHADFSGGLLVHSFQDSRSRFSVLCYQFQ